MMSPMSAEATVVRNYIDWILALPWDEYTDENKRHRRGRARSSTRTTTASRRRRSASSSTWRCRRSSSKMKGPILCLVGPARRRQDLARQVDRARHGPRLRAHLPRRRARRGRDPRPPPHLHRRAARQDHPGPEEGRQRATRSSCSTRSTRCRRTSAAIPSSALLEVLDPEQNHTFNDHYLDLDYDLSRRDVRLHGERAARDPAAAPGPHGDHPAPGLHREREARRSRSDYLVPQAARGERPDRDDRSSSPTPALLEVIRHYTREAGRAQPRARDRLASAARSPARWSSRRRDAQAREGHARSSMQAASGVPQVPLRPGRGRGPGRRRAPASPTPRSAASCSRPRSSVTPGKGKLHAHRPARRGDAGVGATRRCPTSARAPSSSA